MDRLVNENERLTQQNAELQQRVSSLQQEEKRLTGSLQHCRAWSATLSRNQLLVDHVFYNPDDLKPPRRIYVGSLPADTTDAELRQFIKDLMTDRGATCYIGSPVTACKVYPEKNYAFVEFRNVEEASNLMAFDGLVFRDSHLRVRRPNNYIFSLAETLGPTDPNPTIDLSGLDMIKTVVQDSDNKLFIGGLPCEWPEDQVKAELAQFGRLKAFNLVMDKSSGNSKGYAFCEYVDPGCTDDAINSLNSRNIDRRTLTVKRAKETAQPAHPQRSTTAVAAVSQATSQLGLPQSPHTAQSMPHGLPQSQHSMQSMTQGALQPQHSMQSAQGMPRSQHQAPSTQTVPQQGLHQAQHTVSSAQGVSSEAVHAAQLRAGPQMVHPQGQMGPPNGPSTIPRGQFYPQAPVPLPRDQPNPQGAASRPSMQGRGAGPSQRGFYIQQRHPGSESR